jgi:hypothetical protein
MTFLFLWLREPYSRAENTVTISMTSFARSFSKAASSPSVHDHHLAGEVLTQAEDKLGPEAKQPIFVAENQTSDLSRADTGDEML